LGLIWGASGFGKSTAVAWLANQLGGLYVRAGSLWSPNWLLRAIMQEMGAQPMPSNRPMVEYIVRVLAERGRPLFIDEADYLTNDHRLLDILRDLHDLTSTPLILIGMGDFKRRVLHKEQLAGRVAQWVEFQPADLDDARLLAENVCEVELSADLIEELHKATGGSIRGLTVGLSQIETYARRRGMRQVTAADWGNRSFTLSAPTRDSRRDRGAGLKVVRA